MPSPQTKASASMGSVEEKKNNQQVDINRWVMTS
jgi:hypothetical protein